MTFDVIGAVEACYAGDGDDQAWLSGLLDAVSLLARDSGMFAQVFRHREDGSLLVESRVARGISPEVIDYQDRAFRNAPPELVRRFWSPVPPVDYASKRAARMGNAAFDIMCGIRRMYLRPSGPVEQCGVFGADLDGRTVGIFINVPAGAPSFPPRIAHRLRSVAAHLTSGVRLRRALGAGGSNAAGAGDASPEAVLDPAGRALDATGPARERAARATLREAVRLMEKARGRLRRADPDEALRLWQGLVDGTWSLVERYEADGKRYLLARRNQPGVREPTALTRNERSVLAFAAMGHQNKYIGYLLGLSASAVSLHLHSAQRKLRVASRAELIRTFDRVVRPKREGAQAPSIP